MPYKALQCHTLTATLAATSGFRVAGRACPAFPALARPCQLQATGLLAKLRKPAVVEGELLADPLVSQTQSVHERLLCLLLHVLLHTLQPK